MPLFPSQELTKHPRTAGRLTKTDVARLRRRMRPMVPLAVDTIETIMQTSRDDRVRLKAADMVLDRYFGKAVQTLEHSGPDGEPIKFTPERLAQLEIDDLRTLAALMAKVEQVDDPPPIDDGIRNEPADELPEPELIFPRAMDLPDDE